MVVLFLANSALANTNSIELVDCSASSTPIFPVFSIIGTFDGLAAYTSYITCRNQITFLPTSSDDGYEGVWTNATTGLQVDKVDNTLNNVYQTYYFTPNPVSGLDLRTIYLQVYRQNEPQFADYFSTICTTSVVPLLPTTSGNNIAGSWNPATISSTVAGNYVFTPNDPCGFPYTVSVSFRPLQDCNCGAFLSLETSEVNTSKIYENILIKTSNNYTVSGNKTIQLITPYNYIELLPNSSIESQTFFETFLGYNSCFQDTRPANPSLGSIGNDELKNYNIHLEVAPNPSSNIIEVVLLNSTFNKVLITSIDGKTVLDKSIENRESLEVDVSNYANGLYIVSVIDKEGKAYKQKLIKN